MVRKKRTFANFCKPYNIAKIITDWHQMKIYFTAKEYIDNYNLELNVFINDYIDNNENDFLKEQRNLYSICIENLTVWFQESTLAYSTKSQLIGDNFIPEIRNKIFVTDIDDIQNHMKTVDGKYYDQKIRDNLEKSFKKILEFITDKIYQYTFQNQKMNEVITLRDVSNLHSTESYLKEIPNNTKALKWHGTQTEFIELVKALIVNENIKGTQVELIETLSNVFDIEINNPNKLINDIKTRNNGSETLFLDKLKKSLFNYISAEKNKNTR